MTQDAAVWGVRLTLLVATGWVAAEWVGFIPALRGLTFLGFAAAVAGVRRPALGLLGIGMLAVLDPVSRHLVMGSGGLLRWNSFNYWLVLFTLLWLPRVWRLSDPTNRRATFAGPPSVALIREFENISSWTAPDE